MLGARIRVNNLTLCRSVQELISKRREPRAVPDDDNRRAAKIFSSDFYIPRYPLLRGIHSLMQFMKFVKRKSWKTPVFVPNVLFLRTNALQNVF